MLLVRKPITELDGFLYLAKIQAKLVMAGKAIGYICNDHG